MKSSVHLAAATGVAVTTTLPAGTSLAATQQRADRTQVGPPVAFPS